jgi:hypothetical protein
MRTVRLGVSYSRGRLSPGAANGCVLLDDDDDEEEEDDADAEEEE